MLSTLMILPARLCGRPRALVCWEQEKRLQTAATRMKLAWGRLVGITSTPVIDPTTNTLYAVAVSEAGGLPYIQRLHAIDITSGKKSLAGRS